MGLVPYTASGLLYLMGEEHPQSLLLLVVEETDRVRVVRGEGGTGPRGGLDGGRRKNKLPPQVLPTAGGRRQSPPLPGRTVEAQA